jgi:phospholipase/carboxylesterase
MSAFDKRPSAYARPATSRRRFLELTGIAGALSCFGLPARLRAAGEVRLHERPTRPTMPVAPGVRPLGLETGRDGMLFVPKSAASQRALPLIVMLHGAGNRAQGVAYTFAMAEDLGAIVLAPDSRGTTWDAVRGPASIPEDVADASDSVASSAAEWYGPDVAFIDRALQHAFERCAVDRERIALAGFSDGASYALSLGMSNGDLFGGIIAFSPGFVPAFVPLGKPRIFVSHGTRDRVLPIDSASREIVPQLKQRGYDVTYREFDGPHTVPIEVGREAFGWFLKT